MRAGGLREVWRQVAEAVTEEERTRLQTRARDMLRAVIAERELRKMHWNLHASRLPSRTKALKKIEAMSVARRLGRAIQRSYNEK